MLAERNLVASGRRSTDKPVARTERRAPARMTARNSPARLSPAATTPVPAIVLDQAHMAQLLDATTALIHAVTPTMPIPAKVVEALAEVQTSTEPIAQPKVVEPAVAPAPQPVRQTRAEPEAEKTKYTGPMLALRQRSKAGLYAKAENGQPSCGDEIAQMLGVLRPEFVIKACILAMALDFNPYAHLNVGQQSMNLRNKLRGCIKNGEFGMGVIAEAVEEAKAAQDATNH